MKLYSIVLLLQFSGAVAYSQVSFPGGVKYPAWWYVTDENINTPSFAKRYGNDSSSLVLQGKAPGIGYMNFRPALVFNGNNQVTLQTGKNNFRDAVFFTVYQTTDSLKENVIWHTTNESQTGLVLTTSRMANLVDYRYMNYIDRNPMAPKVNAYVQSDTAFTFFTRMHIGYKPAAPSLPVNGFKGSLPELIFYDRSLTGEEFLKVYSYLCLKYGITLSEPEATYLSSNGNTIWDGMLYSAYHHNIAGLVRDDSSGLLQKKACSSNALGGIVFSTEDSIQNNSFLLWGDNDLSFSYAPRIAGLPPFLRRQGLVVMSGQMDSIRTTIQLDTRQTDIPTPFKPVYWLAIDRSGEGNFSADETVYLKMNRLNGAVATFNNVQWKKTVSGKERFGIVAGGNILLSAKITEPSCNRPASGSTDVRIWGAMYPCRVQVFKNENVLVYNKTLTADAPITLPGLLAGRYRIVVTDAMQQKGADSFYINNADGPHSPLLEDTYFIHDGGRVELNAVAGMPDGVSYLWKGPAGFSSLNGKVTVSNEGVYTLTTARNGCSFVKEITVRKYPKNAFTNIAVYPNPTSTGNFEVKVSLDKVSPVSISLFSEDGRLIGYRELKGQANYSLPWKLTASGLYHLVFNAGLSVATREVIITK